MPNEKDSRLQIRRMKSGRLALVVDTRNGVEWYLSYHDSYHEADKAFNKYLGIRATSYRDD